MVAQQKDESDSSQEEIFRVQRVNLIIKTIIIGKDGQVQVRKNIPLYILLVYLFVVLWKRERHSFCILDACGCKLNEPQCCQHNFGDIVIF